MSAIQFKTYSHPYYQQVCDFLITLNREKKHINWNWARWEWMYAHPYCDREKLHTIGLWLDGDTVVGAAIYDLFHGEAFCGALEVYEYLLPEILEYAYANLKDENGLGIAALDDDISMQEQLAQMGFHKTDQTESILCRDMNEPLDYELPSGFAIREIRFPEDNLAYQTVIWKGFDHEGDQAELEKMLENKVLPPNRRSELCLAVVDETGEFAAHCTCWYDERTDYAYVEPVCTIPKYRGMGLGKAVVLEALRRCKALGAKQAFVISDQEFYKKLGFAHHSKYIFSRKYKECGMEIWDAYFFDGTLAGQDLIRGEPISDGLYHLVSEILVRHTDGDYLLMQRDPRKPNYGGFFEATAGGSALKGENAHSCAMRELQEETGIATGTLTNIGRFISRDTIYETFLCVTVCDKNSVTLQEGETVSYKWISEAEFIDFVNSDTMIDVQFRRYQPYLKQIGYIK